MKKFIPLIFLAPFITITLYYLIAKYIYWLFNIHDDASAQLVIFMLTILTLVGIGILLGVEVSKRDD